MKTLASHPGQVTIFNGFSLALIAVEFSRAALARTELYHGLTLLLPGVKAETSGRWPVTGRSDGPDARGIFLPGETG